MKKLSNTKAELKKSVAYKKKREFLLVFEFQMEKKVVMVLTEHTTAIL